MQHVGGRKDVYTGCWWGTVRETDHLEELDVVGMLILKWIFKKHVREAWAGVNCLRKGTGGWLF
jgi:hypothetical protein